MSRDEPTDRQLELLIHVDDGCLVCEPPSTIRELCRLMGVKQVNAVAEWAKACERKGFLTRKPKQARNLRLTPAGEAWVRRTFP